MDLMLQQACHLCWRRFVLFSVSDFKTHPIEEISMALSKSRRRFLTTTAGSASALALAACGSSSVAPAEFLYGVASGDPLSDRVILWTHAKVKDQNYDVVLNWQVAKEANFINIVSAGTVIATANTGFTAKVDATGLTAGTTYFYRFTDNSGTNSPVGTTRTLPATTATSVKFAVFSCTLYSEGFFNSYDAATTSGAEYALHLGDYIYEYGADASKFGNTDAVKLGRVTSPANDIVSLDDYRTRYAKYRSDASLQALHAKMPWITIWDDHEFANNAYMDGAENHNPATQGAWVDRKNTAARVYHEWMPIRTPDASNLLKIYRNFDFGTLFSLHMLDTRIEGRTKQKYGYYGDPQDARVQPYTYADYFAGLTPVNGVYPDAANKMMSDTQMNWLMGNIKNSTATWQIVGNQDIMAKMWFPLTVVQAQTVSGAAFGAALNDYLTAKATKAMAMALTDTQKAILAAPRLPYNMDSWDGYPIQRETLLQSVKATGKKLVVLSGDSHNAWCNNLTSLDGSSTIGVEFATTSVTAPGFESVGLGSLGPYVDGSGNPASQGAYGTGLGLIDDVNFADLNRRGYLLMTVTNADIKGEFVFMDTVKSSTYKASVGKSVTVAAATLKRTYS
jgi:alkaline phosphatase D